MFPEFVIGILTLILSWNERKWHIETNQSSSTAGSDTHNQLSHLGQITKLSVEQKANRSTVPFPVCFLSSLRQDGTLRSVELCREVSTWQCNVIGQHWKQGVKLSTVKLLESLSHSPHTPIFLLELLPATLVYLKEGKEMNNIQNNDDDNDNRNSNKYM